jgi:hypothetical protein
MSKLAVLTEPNNRNRELMNERNSTPERGFSSHYTPAQVTEKIYEYLRRDRTIELSDVDREIIVHGIGEFCKVLASPDMSRLNYLGQLYGNIHRIMIYYHYDMPEELAGGLNYRFFELITKLELTHILHTYSAPDYKGELPKDSSRLNELINYRGHAHGHTKQMHLNYFKEVNPMFKEETPQSAGRKIVTTNITPTLKDLQDDRDAPIITLIEHICEWYNTPAHAPAPGWRNTLTSASAKFGSFFRRGGRMNSHRKHSHRKHSHRKHSHRKHSHRKHSHRKHSHRKHSMRKHSMRKHSHHNKTKNKK